MRKWIVLVLLALALPAFAASDVLDNKGVVEMVHLGLSKDVISAKIKASTTNFDTSPEALARLKREGVPSDIVALMIQGGGAGAAPGAAAGGAGNSVFAFVDANGQQTVMSPVRVTAEMSTRKAWIPFYHGGPETFMFIDGRHAALKTSATPAFVTGMAPLNIRLVHLGQKNDREARYVVFSGSTTDREVQVNSEHLSNGSYRLTPAQPLQAGEEYAFLVQPELPAGCTFWGCFTQYAGTTRAYDFGVQ